MIPKRLDRQGILGIPNLTNLKTPYTWSLVAREGVDVVFL